MRIRIPYNEWSKDKLRRGIKTATSRTKKYGDPGDWFEVEGQKYELTRLTRTPLWNVRDNHWQKEGCESPEEFVEVWESIHPRRGFRLDDFVWLHEFKKLDPEGS